jgi:hypothetical protein
MFGASNFQYQYYEEQLSFSFFSFVAGLGGTLSILLGIDMVIMIEFCFSCIYWFYSFVRWLKRTYSKKTEDNPGTKVIRIGQSKNIVHVQPVRKTRAFSTV